MSYFKGILRSLSQRPDQEEEAIQTLSNRLQHASLAADRKLAVLGLKSFSRQFRESVVQYGLRALLQTLGKDTENAPLVKAVLETLLNLFLRTGDSSEVDAQKLGWISNQSRAQNGKYPSPLLVEPIEIDEFSQWIADEVILTDDHVCSLMLVLQKHGGFQIRLYALQLLEAVVATRAIRAKECILNIPLAISTIVGLLDDPNDPIRNEAILLLMALVNNNYNIQKLVAFENTFERIFAIIEEEGGIRGSILVQDCMTLLTNLLMYNASNQTFFLETDCVPKLASLIAEPIEASSPVGLPTENGDAILAPPIVWTEQRLQNMAILLDICRSFVDPQNQHLVQNQQKLHSSGIFLSILRLVFSPEMENPIRKAALQVTGDIICNNAHLQLQFAHIDVPYIDPSMPLQAQKYTEAIPAPLALLNWALLTNSVHVFEVRLAAVHCLAKFFLGNTDAKMAFLTDQIKASKSKNYYSEIKQSENEAEGVDEVKPEVNHKSEKGFEPEVNPKSAEGFDDSQKTPYANIFTTLTVFNFDVKLNPYSAWFSAVTLVYLISDCPETRQLAREMKVGSAEDGEEEMSSIQAIAGMLIANLENADPRIAVGYLVLLTLWLYEDFEAVNDFLSDATIIKTIVAFLSKNSTESSEIVQGMGSVLVGVCYDFCTKSAPLPRGNLHDLITKSLGADSYALKVKKFKNNLLFKHFDGDLESDFERDLSGLPNLYFIPEYVELVKDNYYRIRKSLSRGPNFEPRSRISFEIYEEMENKNAELVSALEELNLKAEENERNLKSQVNESEAQLSISSELLEKCKLEIEEARKSEEKLIGKIEILSNNIQILEVEKKKLESSSAHYTTEFHKLSKKTVHDEESIKQLTQKFSDAETARQKAEDGINKMSRELFQLTKEKKESDTTISSLEKELVKLRALHEKSIREYQSMIDASRKTNEELRTKLVILEKQGFNPVTNGDEKAATRMRDLQVKVSEMEEANDNLMIKLRSAASVVLGLRSDKLELEKEKESLEVELTHAYEDLEAFTQLLEEVEELKDVHQSRDLDGLELSPEQMRSIVEEKQKLEVCLSKSMKTIEELQFTLAEERENFERERKAPELDEKQRETVEYSNSTASSVTKEEHGDMSSRVQELREEISVLRSNLQDSEETHKLEISAYTDELDILKTDHLSVLAEYEHLKELYEKAVEGRSSQEADPSVSLNKEQIAKIIEDKETELKTSSKRVKELERNIEVLSESASSSLASFKKSQDSLKSRIAQLEESKKKMLEEIDEREQERTKLIRDFQDAYDDLDSSYMDMELLMTNLEKHKDDLEKQLKKLQEDSSNKISKLSIECESLTKTLSEARADRDNLRQEYYELEKLTNIIGSELKAKEALLQAISNKGADLAAKDKIVIEIKEKLASTIADLGDSAQKLRLLNEEKSDLSKLYDEKVEDYKRSEKRISDLEDQMAMSSKELEKSFDENRRLAAVQKNFFEAKKANGEYLTKIETLEHELVSLRTALNEVNQTLDEQRKLNCDNSLTAVLEFTEKSTKLEQSIIENQDLHVSQLEEIRESTQLQIENLNKTLAALKEENEELSKKLRQREFTEAELESAQINDHTLVIDQSRKELEQATCDLEACQENLSKGAFELAAKEKKLEELKTALKEESSEHTSEVLEMRAQILKWETSVSEKEACIEMLKREKTEMAEILEENQREREQHHISKTLGLEKETLSASDISQGDAADMDLLEKDLTEYQEEGLREKLGEKTIELERQSESLAEAHRLIQQLEDKLRCFEAPNSQEDVVNGLRSQIQELEVELQILRETDAMATKDHLGKGLEGHASACHNGMGAGAPVTQSPESESKERMNEEEILGLQEEIRLLKSRAHDEMVDHTTRLRELEASLKEKSDRLMDAESEINDQHERLVAAEEKVRPSAESLENDAREHDGGGEVDEDSEGHSLAQESEISKLREEITGLEARLEEQSEQSREREAEVSETENTQEDFADLVLLCDHQERKIEKYKRKLRALDIVVSSDESEDDLL
ncbi:hypothetical protein METBIDRAFT_31942 [Metschnikowia bicuspidata var. bicuspidata NRRL YB-4993]|uniref:Vesicle tethering protein Uso1/P115-like head domain-containing protein n=1 Tax=Metschnikowia bicuspidata var. bicuspidata NRRL YB-4993 TaxID=869754 RepID=A0A1A0HC02_9ASCO|nr:hypothetical protein METBIDRAFT_31942 [Metschnikowia bicuspidata var. bicuspidata NRRL YB-4993]OBA21418.1 hypothetical protein METBIDRAFT_31942 [Metschnikowia bicuspidata var. bicuspidata NRRL YB-4993]